MAGHGLCMMVRLHNYCRHSAVSCILRSKGNLPSPYHEQPKSCGIAVVSRRSIGVGPADGVDCRRLSSLPAANSMARVRMVVSILRSYGTLNLESFKSHILVRLFGRSLSNFLDHEVIRTRKCLHRQFQLPLDAPLRYV